MIVAEYLSTVIPDEPSEFGAFESVAHRCRKFEDWLNHIGMCGLGATGYSPQRIHRSVNRVAGMVEEHQRYLSSYCAQMHVHFAERKHTKLLRAAREILLSDDHETVLVDEKEPEGSLLMSINLLDHQC